MKTAIAIRHVHFEDLGSLEPALESAGYEIRYADCCVNDIAALDPVAPDLVVVLGGPIGAYQENLYPTVKDELELLEKRLGANRPTIGICLGAAVAIRMTIKIAVGVAANNVSGSPAKRDKSAHNFRAGS